MRAPQLIRIQKGAILLPFLLCAVVSVRGQNLVLNPGFETHATCPSNIPAPRIAQVFDLKGKIVLEVPFGEEEHLAASFHTFESGAYIIRVSYEKGASTFEKILKH